MGYKFRQGETPDHVNSDDSNSIPTPKLIPLVGGDIAKARNQEKMEITRDSIMNVAKEASVGTKAYSAEQGKRLDSIVTLNKKLGGP